jgi:lipopolysaccharide export LptBFGC system permease protein LptF
MAAAGAVVALAGIAFDGWVVPRTQRELKQGLARHLEAFLGSLGDANRTIVLGDGRFSYGRYEAGVFHDVELDQRGTDGTLKRKFVARRARIRRIEVPDHADGGLEFVLEDARIFDATLGGAPEQRSQAEVTFQTAIAQQIGGSTLFNEFFQTRKYLVRTKEMTVSELLYAARRGGVWRGAPRDVLIHLHGRLALGASPFALGLLAMALALVLPATGGRVRDFVLCFLPPILAFFGLHLLGPPLVQAGVPAWIALWSSNVVVGVAGLALFAVAFRR